MIALVVGVAMGCDVPVESRDAGPWSEEVLGAWPEDVRDARYRGEVLVQGLDDGRVRIGDTEHRTGLDSLYQLATSACCVAATDLDRVWVWGPDGSWTAPLGRRGTDVLAVSDDGRVAVGGEVVIGGEARRLYGLGWPESLGWDGDVLYGVVGRSARVWRDLDAMPEMRELDLPDGVRVLAQRGRFAAFGDDAGGRVVDLGSGAVTFGWSGPVWIEDLRADGTAMLASFGIGVVGVVDADGPRRLVAMTGPSARWAPDGRAELMIEGGHRVRFEPTGLPPLTAWPASRVEVGPDGVVLPDQVLFVPGMRERAPAARVGDVVAVAIEGWVVGIDVGTGKEIWRVRPPRPDDSVELVQGWSAGFAFGRMGGEVKVVDTRGRPMTSVYGTAFADAVYARNPDRVVLVAGESALRFDDREIGLDYGRSVRAVREDGSGFAVQYVRAMVEHRDADGEVERTEGPVPQRVTWLSEGVLAAVGLDGRVTRLAVSGAVEGATRPVRQHPLDVAAVGGDVVVAARGGRLAVGCGVREVEGLEAVAHGRRLAFAADGQVFVGDTPRGEAVWRTEQLRWSPDGRQLAFVSDSVQLQQGDRRTDLEVGADLLAWSGDRLLGADDASVRVLGRKRPQVLFEATGGLLDLDATPERIATLDWRGTVGLYTASGTVVFTAPVLAEPLDLALAPDGAHVAASFEDGTVRLWNAAGERLWVARFEDGTVHIHR